MKKHKNQKDEREEGQEEVQKPLLFNNHKKPVTRRDFLAAGLAGMSTAAFTTLLPKEVFAQSMCPTAANLIVPNKVPYLCVDCAGGMNILGGNVLVGQGADQVQENLGAIDVSDYREYGIPDEFHYSKSGMIDKTLGTKFHVSSGILAGIKEALGANYDEYSKHVDFVHAPWFMNDDTSMNEINSAFQAQAAGAKGVLVQLIGSGGNVAGGSSIPNPAYVNLSLKASQLNSFNDSEGLLSMGKNLMGTGFLDASGSGAKERLKKFMEQVARAGVKQREQIASRSPALADELAKYAQRQGGTSDIFNQFSPAQLNPSKNAADGAILAAAYGKAVNTFNGQEQMSANILNLLTTFTAGAGTISVGGGDYHTGDAVTGAAKDREIGRYIGYSIAVAMERDVPFFGNLFTDGSTGGDRAGLVDPMMPNRVVWRGDDGPKSGVLMWVVNPKKVRVAQAAKGHADEGSNFLLSGVTRQIGWINKGKGVNLGSHSLANNTSNAWKLVILNYLATRVKSTDDQQIKAMVEEHFKCIFGELPPGWENMIRFRSLVA